MFHRRAIIKKCKLFGYYFKKGQNNEILSYCYAFSPCSNNEHVMQYTCTLSVSQNSRDPCSYSSLFSLSISVSLSFQFPLSQSFSASA